MPSTNAASDPTSYRISLPSESTVRFSFLVLLLVYGIMSNNTLFRAPEGPYLSFAGAKVRQLFELAKYYTDFF